MVRTPFCPSRLRLRRRFHFDEEEEQEEKEDILTFISPPPPRPDREPTKIFFVGFEIYGDKVYVALLFKENMVSR